jgi:AcrR family transcriptional regulator
MNDLPRKRLVRQATATDLIDNDHPEQVTVRRDPLNRQDWVSAARELLIQGGIENVRIGRLAESLNVTRGGFYWLFSSREELLDELLQDWKRTNTRPFEKILNTEHKGVEELKALVDMWIQEEEYSPPYDSAVRDWARMSATTAEAVKEIDSRRIELMKHIFLDLGYAEEEAFVRARITYFHQVGYYILGLGETQETRVKALPLYLKVLSGLDFD